MDVIGVLLVPVQPGTLHWMSTWEQAEKEGVSGALVQMCAQ